MRALCTRKSICRLDQLPDHDTSIMVKGLEAFVQGRYGSALPSFALLRQKLPATTRSTASWWCI